MGLPGKIVCCLAMIAAVPVLASAALPRASASSLHLTVQPQSECHAGKPINIDFVLQNIGAKPLLLFHPDNVHASWLGWEISCTVTRPDGEKVRLEPEMQDTNGHFPQQSNFREIMIGGMVVTTLTVDGNEVRDPGGRWIGCMKIQKERRAWTEKALRRRYGIRGAYNFKSDGEDISIILNEPGKDVFGQPGRYIIECRYNNPNGQIFDEHQRLLPVSAWTGTLTTTYILEILP